jgi:hypothetical protein
VARERLEHFRAVPSKEGAAGRLAYFEGRVLQLEGNHAHAVDGFEEARTSAPHRPEPVLRAAECLLALGDTAAAEGRLREAMEGGLSPSLPVIELWLDAAFRSAGGDLTKMAVQLPNPSGDPPDGLLFGARAVLDALSQGRPFRINCGDEQDGEIAGSAWSRDRFFTAGRSVESKALDGAFATALFKHGRVFAETDAVAPGYRLPVPPGRYRVTVHLAEGEVHDRGKRVFDMAVGGRRFAEGFEPLEAGFAVPQSRVFEAEATGGALEVLFLRRSGDPVVFGLEVKRAQ